MLSKLLLDLVFKLSTAPSPTLRRNATVTLPFFCRLPLNVSHRPIHHLILVEYHPLPRSYRDANASQQDASIFQALSSWSGCQPNILVCISLITTKDGPLTSVSLNFYPRGSSFIPPRSPAKRYETSYSLDHPLVSRPYRSYYPPHTSHSQGG